MIAAYCDLSGIRPGISAVLLRPIPQSRGDDGTAARLATYFDTAARRDLLLVWKIDVDDNVATLTLIRAENAE